MIPNHETQTRFAESNSPLRREKLGYRWNEKFSIKPHGYVFKKLLRLKTFCQRFVNEPETGLRFDSKNEKKETRRQTRFAFNERKRTLWETEDLSLSLIESVAGLVTNLIVSFFPAKRISLTVLLERPNMENQKKKEEEKERKKIKGWQRYPPLFRSGSLPLNSRL